VIFDQLCDGIHHAHGCSIFQMMARMRGLGPRPLFARHPPVGWQKVMIAIDRFDLFSERLWPIALESPV
jgi:hypothetical protein